MPIPVLFGTETGNAEMVADDVAEVLSDFMGAATAGDMSDVDVTELPGTDLLVLVCSTYGEGGLPESAQPFHDALLAERPDLTGVRFAVFGLGDSAYETFNNGSTTLAATLTGLGAVRVGEHGVHDASSGLLSGDVARHWATQLSDLL